MCSIQWLLGKQLLCELIGGLQTEIATTLAHKFIANLRVVVFVSECVYYIVFGSFSDDVLSNPVFSWIDTNTNMCTRQHPKQGHSELEKKTSPVKCPPYSTHH